MSVMSNDNYKDYNYFSCKYMPAGAEEEFRQGELDSMFPEGIDDGFNFSDFGEN